MKIKYILSNDKRVSEYNKFILKNFPQFTYEENPEIILVAGGDGAMHHAIYDNQDS